MFVHSDSQRVYKINVHQTSVWNGKVLGGIPIAFLFLRHSDGHILILDHLRFHHHPRIHGNPRISWISRFPGNPRIPRVPPIPQIPRISGVPRVPRLRLDGLHGFHGFAARRERLHLHGLQRVDRLVVVEGAGVFQRGLLCFVIYIDSEAADDGTKDDEHSAHNEHEEGRLILGRRSSKQWTERKRDGKGVKIEIKGLGGAVLTVYWRKCLVMTWLLFGAISWEYDTTNDIDTNQHQN